MRDYALLYVNGRRHEIRGAAARKMLAGYLREDLGLTGTKIVCAEGDCGACSVLRWHPYPDNFAKLKRFESFNSCISTVAQMDGSNLITVEGLAKGGLSPVQKAMVDCHGSQCGFCTPGFVVALTGLVEKRLSREDRSAIHDREAKNALTGNLCRCTGYQPILDAARAIPIQHCERLSERYSSREIERELRKACAEALFIEGEDFSFYAPLTSKEAVKYLAKRKNARILGAGTDLGVLVNKHKMQLVEILSLHLIEDLYEMKRVGKNRFYIGARVTLAQLRRAIGPLIPEFARFIDIFASSQIKNVATLVGNVANASPIADTAPFLLAANAAHHVLSAKGKREVTLDSFYKGYKKTALKPGDVILGIEIDIPDQTEFVRLEKVSTRRDLDISTVNAAFRWNRDSGETRVAVGGVAGTPLRLKKIEEKLYHWIQTKGKVDLEALHQAFQKEITPLSDLRGSAAYRRVTAENLFARFLKEAMA